MTRDLPTTSPLALELSVIREIDAALAGFSPSERIRIIRKTRQLLGFAPPPVESDNCPTRGPRKARRASIRKLIADAEKAGKPVTSVTLPDGTKLDFSKATDATADDEVENWFRKQKGH
jgi:hypothetical protein